MIDFDFNFVQPTTTEEALKTFHAEEHKEKMYVSGATEFISRARMREVMPEVVIDTKLIPECHVFEENDLHILIGSAVPLNKIIDANYFPLLTAVCRGIASRTARNKVTLGGNLLSNLPYKETMLPFLLADSQIIVATNSGIERRSFEEIEQLEKGELLLQIITDKQLASATYQYKRKTRQSNINYPIVTAAALMVEEDWRYAFSGMCNEPFSEKKLDKLLNDSDSLSATDMAKTADLVPSDVLDDINASQAFRIHLFQTTLNQMTTERNII